MVTGLIKFDPAMFIQILKSFWIVRRFAANDCYVGYITISAWMLLFIQLVIPKDVTVINP